MTTEQYKPVNYLDFGDYYDVSNLGNVRSNYNKRVLTQKDNNGYLRVAFSKPINKSVSVSRLVAFTFIPNDKPDEKTVVNHIDENKHNNHVTNLEWSTQKYNVNISTKDKTHRKQVIQKDLQGNVIGTFDTINDAAKAVGVDRTTIGKVLVGVNQTAGGFKWEYKDESMKPKENVDLTDCKNLSFLSDELSNYYVFKDGNVFNKTKRIFLKPCLNSKGALYITLSKDKKKKQNFYIQQLVAMCYIPNPDDKKRVKHLDGNKSNNSVENLEWF